MMGPACRMPSQTKVLQRELTPGVTVYCTNVRTVLPWGAPTRGSLYCRPPGPPIGGYNNETTQGSP